jgi:transcriptional regulator with XRE-family HTH domain
MILVYFTAMERDSVVLMVAANLADAMARKGTNAAEVARRAGINPTGVYDILKGKSRSPRLDTLHKIAVLGLGIPLTTLFTEPSDDALDQQLLEVLGLLSVEDRKRFLTMAMAVQSQPANS